MVAALVRLEGHTNREVTIDSRQYYSYDWESFRAPDDSRVRERDPDLARLLDELCEICIPHCEEDEVLTALVDLNSLEIVEVNLEKMEFAPE